MEGPGAGAEAWTPEPRAFFLRRPVLCFAARLTPFAKSSCAQVRAGLGPGKYLPGVACCHPQQHGCVYGTGAEEGGWQFSSHRVSRRLMLGVGGGGGGESGSEVAPVRMTAWQLWLVDRDSDFSTARARTSTGIRDRIETLVSVFSRTPAGSGAHSRLSPLDRVPRGCALYSAFPGAGSSDKSSLGTGFMYYYLRLF